MGHASIQHLNTAETEQEWDVVLDSTFPAQGISRALQSTELAECWQGEADANCPALGWSSQTPEII